MGFIDNNCAIFVNDEENKFEYSNTHRDFVATVEDIIDEQLGRIGITVDQFVVACETEPELDHKVAKFPQPQNRPSKPDTETESQYVSKWVGFLPYRAAGPEHAPKPPLCLVPPARDLREVADLEARGREEVLALLRREARAREPAPGHLPARLA